MPVLQHEDREENLLVSPQFYSYHCMVALVIESMLFDSRVQNNVQKICLILLGCLCSPKYFLVVFQAVKNMYIINSLNPKHILDYVLLNSPKLSL